MLGINQPQNTYANQTPRATVTSVHTNPSEPAETVVTSAEQSQPESNSQSPGIWQTLKKYQEPLSVINTTLFLAGLVYTGLSKVRA